MADQLHGKDALLKIGGNTICWESFDIAAEKESVEATTSCDDGRVYLYGKEGHTLNPGGALQFGTNSTEQYLWALWQATADATWAAYPTGATTASDTNAVHSGSLRLQQYTLSFGLTAPIRFGTSMQGSGALARATS